MATYISLVQFTDKGIHAAKETTQRVAEWAAKVQSKGVTLKHMYWTLGQYDQVCVFEAPDDETAASVLLSADMLGNIRTQTLRAFTSDEMGLLFGSYDRGASRPAVVVCWITSRRSALVSRPLARVHHRTIGEAMKMDE
jgi:uncharacterized protein with GYD domain